MGSPRQVLGKHFVTQFCHQSTRVGEVDTPVVEPVGEGGVISVRPTEEADKIIKKGKKEPTDASEPGSREDVRVMDEVSSARAQYGPERPSERLELPEEPAEEKWEPTRSPREWCDHLWQQLPVPLRRWVKEFEPGMQCSWRCMAVEQRSMLSVLKAFATRFVPARRRKAVEWLFETKGLLRGELAGEDKNMFEKLFCGMCTHMVD